MTDAGYFKGTSTDQDSRFTDKKKKLIKSMKFSNNLSQKVDTQRVNVDSVNPWIIKRITELLSYEDDIVCDFVVNLLSEQFPDPKDIQIYLTAFLGGKSARTFVTELWDLLLSAMNTPGGVPAILLEAKKAEIASIKANEGRYRGDLSFPPTGLAASAESHFSTDPKKEGDDRSLINDRLLVEGKDANRQSEHKERRRYTSSSGREHSDRDKNLSPLGRRRRRDNEEYKKRQRYRSYSRSSSGHREYHRRRPGPRNHRRRNEGFSPDGFRDRSFDDGQRRRTRNRPQSPSGEGSGFRDSYRPDYRRGRGGDSQSREPSGRNADGPICVPRETSVSPSALSVPPSQPAPLPKSQFIEANGGVDSVHSKSPDSPCTDKRERISPEDRTSRNYFEEHSRRRNAYGHKVEDKRKRKRVLLGNEAYIEEGPYARRQGSLTEDVPSVDRQRRDGSMHSDDFQRERRLHVLGRERKRDGRETKRSPLSRRRQQPHVGAEINSAGEKKSLRRHNRDKEEEEEDRDDSLRRHWRHSPTPRREVREKQSVVDPELPQTMRSVVVRPTQSKSTGIKEHRNRRSVSSSSSSSSGSPSDSGTNDSSSGDSSSDSDSSNSSIDSTSSDSDEDTGSHLLPSKMKSQKDRPHAPPQSPISPEGPKVPALEEDVLVEWEERQQSTDSSNSRHSSVASSGGSSSSEKARRSAVGKKHSHPSSSCSSPVLRKRDRPCKDEKTPDHLNPTKGVKRPHSSGDSGRRSVKEVRSSKYLAEEDRLRLRALESLKRKSAGTLG